MATQVSRGWQGEWSIGVPAATGDGPVMVLTEDDEQVTARLRGGDLAASVVEALTAWGWQAADDDFVWIAPVVDAAAFASALTTTLRAVLGVVSPEFLILSGEESDDGALEELWTSTHFVEEPRGRRRFVDAVRRAAELVVRRPVQPAADGSIEIVVDDLTILVETAWTSPVVRLRCEVVREVRKSAQAAIEVNLANRDNHGATFHLVDRTVWAHRHLRVDVFSSVVFAATVADFVAAVTKEGRDVTTRCGGRLAVAQ